MIIRSKAPLRLGLAGGGSDVSPYSDLYGGFVLNATINLYAYCTIEETNDGKIKIVASDLEQYLVYDTTESFPINRTLDLHKGVYNRILKEFQLCLRSFRIITTIQILHPEDVRKCRSKRKSCHYSFSGKNIL
jgi:D-glycero-alpha-D-manno-heptose-7-phosphate kinase